MESNHKLPENCVEYNIFILEKDGVVKREFSQIWAQLESLCSDVYSVLARNLAEYIWHKEPFRLAPFKRPFPHVGGRTVFGENIEDEWFIVWLLLEISKRFANTAICVYDEDGQFLLIEAADFLPAWLGPENSGNRVWIHRGRIHIIPEIVGKQRAGSGKDEELSVEEALAWLAKDPGFTLAPKEVEEAIQQRIAGYPKNIIDAQHRMHCCVPAAVAVLMKTKPSLLSAAIDAFYLRDPIDLRTCKAMKHFPPETRVLSDVTTSKLQYAQLLQQKFHPDKRTGWDLPTPDDPHYKALDLGMKIASGFEILCSYGERAKGQAQFVTYEALDGDKEWQHFLLALEKSGFFQKASHLQFNGLINKAKDFFIESRRTDESHIPKERFGAIVLQLIRSIDVDINGLKKQSRHLPAADDDSWLNMSPEQLDNLLDKRTNGTGGSSNHANGAEFDPALITESIKRFMEIASGLEGAEFTDEKEDQHSMDTRAMDQTIGKILEFNITDDEDEARNSSAMTDYSDEEEHAIDLPRGSKSELEGIQAYLHRMDRELAKTKVGESFVRETNGNGHKHTNGSKPSRSRPRPPVPARKNSEMAGDSNESIDEEDDDYHPVDMDVNLLKNVLESINSEQGLPGPASNLLKRMGVGVPANKD